MPNMQKTMIAFPSGEGDKRNKKHTHSHTNIRGELNLRGCPFESIAIKMKEVETE